MKEIENRSCPVCKKDMVRYGKKANFIMMFIVSLFIWPMFLFLPFAGFLPVRHTCRSCKKTYKEKDLLGYKL